MIDRPARDQLAEKLRHLISGRLTNDQFDAARPEDCEDDSVHAVWQWAYTLYGSDLPFPYRLRSRHRVSWDLRQQAARAIVFLHSDIEYEWPSFDGFPAPFWGMPFGPGCCLLLGLPALAVALISACVAEWWQALWIGLVSLRFLIIPMRWLLSHRAQMEQARQFYAAGDVGIWPFMNAENYAWALQNPRLLTGRNAA
jgi:hypothetical protein